MPTRTNPPGPSADGVVPDTTEQPRRTAEGIVRYPDFTTDPDGTPVVFVSKCLTTGHDSIFAMTLAEARAGIRGREKGGWPMGDIEVRRLFDTPTACKAPESTATP